YDGPLQFAMTDGCGPDSPMTTVQVLPMSNPEDGSDDAKSTNRSKALATCKDGALGPCDISRYFQ
ncbi:hypothetical protein Anas_05302, partial [Armadillidium nasatum]